MGNQILGKKTTESYNGFSKEQIKYLKEKFSILKNQKGYLDIEKIKAEFRLKDQTAKKVAKLFDMSSDQQELDTFEIDEYQFICSVAEFCNTPMTKISQMIFDIISIKETGKELNNQPGVDQKALQLFTYPVLHYNKHKKKGERIKDTTFVGKKNAAKFKNANVDRSKYINKSQFVKFCKVDNDYKEWMYNMGFISKKQLENKEELLYDDFDEDLEDQLYRHTQTTDPEVDKIKTGIEHKNNQQKLTMIQKAEDVDEAAGDHLWRNEIAKMTDWKDQADKFINKPNPSQNLTIQYAFGYRGFDSRNNLHYNKTGKIVYPTASLGVVYNSEGKQDFIIAHNNDVSCLDVNRDLAASGQIGSKPTVLVWETERQKQQQSLKIRHYLTEGLIESIGNIVFSPKQRYLAVSCNNQSHNIVIYDLQLLKKAQDNISSTQTGVVVSDKSTPQVILAMQFSHDEKNLIVATISQVIFFTFQTGSLKSNRCVFGEFQKSTALSLCRLQLKDYFATGMANGSIYIWNERNCIKALSEHTSPVFAVKNRSDKNKGNSNKSLISGDKKGNIILWNDKFQKQRQFKVPQITQNRCIVSLSTFDQFVLVGTKGCQIFQFMLENIEQPKIKTIMQSHSVKHLKALCVGQGRTVYTGGQDKVLFKYQISDKNKSVVMRQQKQYPIASIDCYCKNGAKLLAVGYSNGVVDILKCDDIKQKKQSFSYQRNPDCQVLNLIRFSPDGKYLAMCYTFPEFIVVLYDMRKSAFAAYMDSESKVTSLDFSEDSKFLRINTEGEDLLIFNLHSRVQQKDKKIDWISNMQDISKIHQEKWATHTLTMSWTTSKIFSQKIKQSQITFCKTNSKNKNTLIVGDIYSKLKVYNYPCIQNKMNEKQELGYNRYKGHGGEITGISFLEDDSYVMSIGGEDKTLIVWKFDNVEGDDYQDEKVGIDYGEQAFDEEDQQTPQQKLQSAQLVSKIEKQEKIHQQKQDLFDQYEMVQIVQIPIDNGQQAMATSSFEGQIVAPSWFQQKEKRDNKLPKQDLKILHTFGIRTFYLADEIRNQARFNSGGKKVVYPTAALGVEMDTNSLVQQFYQGHKEDIVSFAIDNTRKIAATGQMAQLNHSNPKSKIVSIHVWNVDNKSQLKVLNNFHTIAVVLLSFSPDSTLLFSCGNDNQNSYAVYNWKAGIILFSGPVSKAKVNGISWKNNFQFATCGNDHVKFWTKNKSLQGKTEGRSQQQFSIISSKSVYISGGGKGNLYNWNGNIGKRIDAHKDKVQTLAISQNQLYSGSEDGTIMVWEISQGGSIKSKCSKILDMRKIILQKNLRQKQYSILSIDFNPKSDDTMLIVTGGCEIYTMQKDGTKIKKLLSGHYKKQLWGLAICPQSDDKFVTAGDDGTVRLWNLNTRRMEKKQVLENQKSYIRAVDWSNKQGYIVAADNDSKLHLFSEDLKQVKTGPSGFQTWISKDAKSVKLPPWVEDIKISPNDNFIAFGGHNRGKTVQIVNYNNGVLKKTGQKFTGFSSSILHIDWCKDSKYLSANSQSYQLLFFSPMTDDNKKKKDQMMMISASNSRDIEWHTQTKKIAFPVRGIFQGVDYSDVKSVDTDKNKKLIAVGYTDQVIRLFKYPAYVPKQVHKSFYGHSSFVTKIKFNKNHMISIGGNDKTIIVWKVLGRQLENQDKKQKVGSKQKNGQQQEDIYQEQEQILDEIDVPMKAIKQPVIEVQQDDFAENENVGDQFMAIKPWLGAIRQPTYAFPKQTQKAPNVKIQLEHVYGYRCKDSRQNIFYSKNDQNQIIYHAAAVVIGHNTKNNIQTFNTDHTDDILSIAYHKEKNLVLTGQLGPKPFIILTENQQFKCSWRNAVTKGVLCLAISPSGKKAACAGMDDDHMVAVIDLLKTNSVLAKKQGGKNIILKCEWIDQNSFVTVGIKHFKLWSFQNGKLSSKNASGTTLMNYVSLAVSEGMILTGSQSNTLTEWKGSSLKKKISLDQLNSNQEDEGKNLRSGAVVECIIIKKNYIVAGSKDKNIYILNKDLNIQNTIRINIQNLTNLGRIVSQCASVRAIDISKDQKSIIVGTLGSQIYEFKFNSTINKLPTDHDFTKKQEKVKVQVNDIMKGHYSPNTKWTNQVWGLCVDTYKKNSKKFFTTSDDATVRCWDWEQKQMISIQSLNFGPIDDKGKAKPLQKDKKLNDYVDSAKGRVVSLSPEGQLFVGCKSGMVRIFDFKNQQIEYKNLFKKATREISEIKFHNQIVVIGAHDAHIYVYDYKKDTLKEKYKALKKHSSYITHLDISRDCCFLQSTCGAYELLFWDLQTGKQLTGGASMLKDERWATWSSTLGWPVQGIWPKYSNGTFIHSVDRSNTNISNTDFKSDPTTPYLLAVGNNDGRVLIHNYPCLEKGSLSVQGIGHSSHITNVKWTPDDSRILSAGGQDQCIMQWKVTKIQGKASKK